MNIVLVKHASHGSTYIFSVPENVMVKKDDIVLCDTNKGESVGYCCCDSFHLDGSPLEFLVKEYGGKMPLKKVIGRCRVERWAEPELPY